MFGFRFRRRPHSGRALHPLAIVGICLAVAVLLTLTVGNLLRIWLDDETYKSLTEGNERPATEETPDPVDVPNVNAYPFSLAEEVDRVIGFQSVSVELNNENRVLSYSSGVAAHLGLPQTSGTDLFEKMDELALFVPYVSGIYRPQGFDKELSDVFYAAAVQDIALLREFIHAGGDEILLCDVPLDDDSMDRVKTYLALLKAALPDTPVGVAVPLSCAADTKNWKIMDTLSVSCDFLVLDLSDEVVIDGVPVSNGEPSPAALALLADCSHIVSIYRTRLLVAASQAPLLSTLEIQMHPNFQVWNKPSASAVE